MEDEKGQLGCGEGYSALGYGYEGVGPLNDVYGYRRDEKYTSIHPPAANAGAEVKADEDGNGMAAATLAPAHFDIIYANQRQQNQHPHQYQHRRAVSDAAGTTFSCPADFNFAYHHGGGGDGDSDHAKGNGNGNGEAFPGGPSQHTAWHPSTGQVESGSVAEAEYEREVDVMDSASNAPFRSSVAGAAAAAATAERDNGTYTPRSPYRPGEYSYASLRRSTRGGVSYSERTSSRIERKLFRSSRDDVDGDEEHEQEQEQEQPKRNRGSSPLQPPFEARLFLRAGASVDVISWYVYRVVFFVVLLLLSLGAVAPLILDQLGGGVSAAAWLAKSRQHQQAQYLVLVDNQT